VPATYECATYQVPLDHADPGGEQIDLALVRRPADDPAARLGSLFVNPGGPGGSGVDLVVGAGEFLFPPDVLAAYDLVGFDPRGTNRSTPLQCFDGTEDADDYFFDRAWPETRAEVREVAAANRAFDRRCEELGGPIRDHMSTTDVARDLEVLRQAVGDEQLNYYGISYGSALGSYYANLYPDRVGAVVVDAVLDPVRWSTGREEPGRFVPTTTRLRSGDGALATAGEFFRLCDEAGPEACPLAPGAEARWQALYDALEAEPIVFGPGSVIDHQFVTSLTLGFLYDSLAWPVLAAELVYLEDLAAGRVDAGAPEEQARLGELRAQLDPQYAGPEQFPGVLCLDSVQPARIGAWSRATARNPQPFAQLWGWADANCEEWSAADEDRYLGPFDRETANPVLIASTTFDPATPYEMAELLRATLPNSRLLTVEGWGHATPLLSACAEEVKAAYLLTRTVPDADVVCAQDIDPFAPPAEEPPAEALRGAPERVADAQVEARAQELEAGGDQAAADRLRARAVVSDLIGGPPVR
jgi:pimeloyl-ACP methyl ester carboxylesterase